MGDAAPIVAGASSCIATRLTAALAVAVAAASLVGATQARAGTVTLGSTTLASNDGTADLFGKNVPVFQGRAASGYQVSAPLAGTIVSWSFRSAGVAKGSHFVLRVMRPVDATTWRAAATSAPATVSSATGTDAVVGPFTAAIAVLPGDRIALQPIDGVDTPIEAGTNGKDGVRYFISPLTDGSTESLAPGATADNGQIVPIQATVRPATTALANTAAPVISGTPALRRTLTCSAGEWAQKPDSLVYAWLRDGTAIPAATAAAYLVAAADLGRDLACRVTATAGIASGTATSHPVAVPAAAANTSAPRVLGAVKSGSTVSCNPGTWTGSPTFAYDWVWQKPIRFTPFHVRPGSKVFGVPKTLRSRAARPVTATVTLTLGTRRTLVVPDLPANGGRLGCIVSAAGGASSAATSAGATSRLAPMSVLPPELERGRGFRVQGPSITRNVGSGGTNTCRAGLWAHFPTFTYAWYRVGARASKVSLLPLLGRGQNLRLTPANEGMDIECVVTATNRAGSVALPSNHYAVPAGAPHPLQQPFVDVATESPNTAPGLVGPEGASVVAEKIHLRCVGGRWDRSDITTKTAWYIVDQRGALSPEPFVAGDRLDLDMSPGKPQLAAGFACVVTATTSHGVSGTSRSGLFSLWNGCVETRGGDEISIGTVVSPYGLGLAAGTAATIATGGLAGLIASGAGAGWGYGPPPLGWGAGFGPSNAIVYTVGPNCLDYQRWLERQGYTVKQRDG